MSEDTINKSNLRTFKRDKYDYHDRVWDKKKKDYINLYTRREEAVLEVFDEETKTWKPVPKAYEYRDRTIRDQDGYTFK